MGEMSHFIDLLQALTGSFVQRVIAERVSGDNQAIVNNDNIVISLKFRDGSVGNLAYSASGAKAYSREMLEIFCEGQTLVLEDFRESERHGLEKQNVSRQLGKRWAIEKNSSTLSTVWSARKSLWWLLPKHYRQWRRSLRLSSPWQQVNLLPVNSHENPARNRFYPLKSVLLPT